MSAVPDAIRSAVPTPADLRAALASGELVPVAGPGILAGISDRQTGAPMPRSGEELILAMNGGKPMAPKLMYEFARAAMNVELKRGRPALQKFLVSLYDPGRWTEGPLHAALDLLDVPYLIDLNRDAGLQILWADRPHILVTGFARIASGLRYRLHTWDGHAYKATLDEELDTRLPVLFKPLGSPLPEPTFIASDADYVDYITELMGGFAIPPFLKKRRQGLRYLMLGLRFDRDTERMIVADLIQGAASPAAYALIPEPNDKERRWCRRMGIEIVESPAESVLLG